MLRVVIDTNLWIRVLLGGEITLPVLEAWRNRKFTVIASQHLIDELDAVWQRPRLRRRIRSELVVPTTVPPRCRDPKDHPVLAAAIDGRADAIISGDADLRADDELRAQMQQYGVALWGVDTLLEHVQG